MDETREQYIDDELKAIRERHVVELVRAKQFFGEEWDKEHSDDLVAPKELKFVKFGD